MDPESFKCPNCDAAYVNLNSLRIHAQKKHGTKSIDLRLALFHDGVRPTCECGCGEETAFDGLVIGFVRFVNGHNARVENSWGHNPVALAKSQEVRRGMWKRGEIKAWRTGLSPDEPRNKALIEKMTATVRADASLRKQRSETMTQNRLSRVVPNLTGKDHPAWRGGASALQPLVRSHLHARWVYPKLKAANFTCQLCGKNHVTLNVHHDQERFAAILQMAIATLGEVMNDDFEQKSLIAEWVADYHVKNDVSGIVLCETCHDLQHVAT